MNVRPTSDSPSVLVIPGLDGSCPGHWQSIWERTRGDCRRVEQRDWSNPDPLDWSFEINRAVKAAGRRVILVAHSLGCLAVAHWAAIFGRPYAENVAGALLVAPPDPERADLPATIRSFLPDPWAPLPFRTTLVASTDDRYASIERAQSFARVWSARFVNVGALGHINVESRIGAWRPGQALLAELILADRREHGPIPTIPPLRARAYGVTVSTRF